jgi:hypothetical protein
VSYRTDTKVLHHACAAFISPYTDRTPLNGAPLGGIRRQGRSEYEAVRRSLGITAALFATSCGALLSTSSHAAQPIARCQAAALRFTLGPVVGPVDQQPEFEVRLHNITAKRCTLAGYADVAFNLPQDKGRYCFMPRDKSWGDIERIELPPHGTAVITVAFLPGDYPVMSDDPSDVPLSLSVRLPGETDWVSLSWTPSVSVHKGHYCGGPTHPGTYTSPIHRSGRR